jgi:hypothetical protein
MKLYAVRDAQTKQPVGLFYADDPQELSWMVDSHARVDGCEYCTLGRGAILFDAWEDKGEVDDLLARDLDSDSAKRWRSLAGPR